MRAGSSIMGIFLLAGTALLSPPALAQTLAEQAAAIDAKMAARDSDAALQGALDLYGSVWEQSPEIRFREALLVSQPAAGFGIYNPRPDDRFKKGDPVIIYVEPIGFGYGAPAVGLVSIGFVVDLKVTSIMGEVMGDVPSLTEVNLTSRARNREFQANLTYNLQGIPAGRYVLETTLRDKNSAKTGVFALQIEIVE